MTTQIGNYKITKEEFIHRYYDNLESMFSICKSLGVSQSPFADKIRKEGFQLRTHREAHTLAIANNTHKIYRAHYNIFDTWSPKMAWTLGLIASEGNIQKDRPYIQFINTETELMEKFKSVIEYTGSYIWHNGSRSYSISLYSQHMVDSLLKLGITPRKSLTLDYPPVPIEYLPDFARGYLDGDGCIFIKKSKNRFDKLAVVYISASEKFIDGLHNAFSMVGIKCMKRLHHRPDREHDQYRIYANSYEALKLCKYIYQNSTDDIRLGRKYNIYTKYEKEYGHIYANGALRDMHMNDICSVEGCGKPTRSLGFCHSHYMKEYHKNRH